MKPRALLARLARGELADVSFPDAERLAEALGFTLDRVAGSHHIYRHPDVTDRLNLQASRSGDAKPYQLRQLLQLAERHALTGGEAVSEYHINLFWSPEDDAWIADVPDLTYCSAHGPTPEEALREVLAAQEAWLESARAHGDPIPPRRYRPAIYAAG